jgi:ABC-type antimicrobial peptide transport system permease subunit
MVTTRAVILEIGNALSKQRYRQAATELLKALEADPIPMTYSFTLDGLVAAVAVGLIFGVIAALIPARQAAGMEIVRARQYE